MILSIYSIIRVRPITTNITYDPAEIYDADWVDPQVLIDAGYDQVTWAIESLNETSPEMKEIHTTFKNQHHVIYGRKPSKLN